MPSDHSTRITCRDVVRSLQVTVRRATSAANSAAKCGFVFVEMRVGARR